MSQQWSLLLTKRVSFRKIQYTEKLKALTEKEGMELPEVPL